MVYYFTSTSVDPPAQIYMGKDSTENEGLISHGWPEDVWFHVDNLSSAHVYIRLPSQDSSSGVEAGNGPATSWTEIPEPLLADCAQLTKANSIEGNKKDNVTVIYTPWSNLHKDGSMKTGAVGFKDDKLVRKVFVKQRENAVINRLSKTRVERFPDLRAERQARDQGVRAREAEAARLKKKEELRIAKEYAEKRYQKDHAYDDLHDEDAIQGSSNQDRDADFLDDFM